MMLSAADIDLLHWIQQHRPAGLDGVLQGISAVATLVSFAVIVAAIVYARVRKKSYRGAWQLAVTLLLAFLLNLGLKEMFDRERPFRTHETIEQLSQGGSPSFPSGHTMEAFAMATALALLYRNRRITAAAFLWATVVGYSRMALGVHYPTDILGGIIAGTLSALLVGYLFGKFVRRP
jgi:undecaprenyl-diphosphatase